MKDMTDEEKYIYEQSELYAQNKEIEEEKWWHDNEAKYIEIMAKIDILLSEHTPEAIDRFELIFSDIDSLNELSEKTDFAAMFILYKIYIYEKQIGLSDTVFTYVDSVEDAKLVRVEANGVEDAIEKMNRLRYILWRIEFTEDMSECEQLVRYIMDVGISAPFLLVMIETSSFNKAAMKNLLIQVMDAAGLIVHRHIIEKITISIE